MNYKNKYLKYKMRYLDSIVEKRTLTNEQISEFCLSIFTYLKNFNVCFINGAFVFEDNHQILLNLFTFNIPYEDVKIEQECPPQTANTHATTTHRFFQTNDNILNLENDCISRDLKPFSIFNLELIPSSYLKLEKILEPSINNICDRETASIDYNISNNETKQIILYYPFINEKTGKKYIYVKFESHPINSLEHLSNLLDKKRTSTYLLRREDDEYLNEDLDIIFYREHYQKLYEEYYKDKIISEEELKSIIDEIFERERIILNEYNLKVRSVN